MLCMPPDCIQVIDRSKCCRAALRTMSDKLRATDCVTPAECMAARVKCSNVYMRLCVHIGNGVGNLNCVDIWNESIIMCAAVWWLLAQDCHIRSYLNFKYISSQCNMQTKLFHFKRKQFRSTWNPTYLSPCLACVPSNTYSFSIRSLSLFAHTANWINTLWWGETPYLSFQIINSLRWEFIICFFFFAPSKYTIIAFVRPWINTEWNEQNEIDKIECIFDASTILSMWKCLN